MSLNERQTVTLKIMGTQYYRAPELFKKSSLKVGTVAKLERQPNNAVDRNAVAIKQKNTGSMLGHVSKGLAPKYVSLLKNNQIIGATISEIKESGKYLNINVHVTYVMSGPNNVSANAVRIEASAKLLPPIPGIYAITNIVTKQQYIGSSKNMYNRGGKHTQELSSGIHPNHALQSAFSQYGGNNFQFEVLRKNLPLSELPNAEASEISSSLSNSKPLYNLTVDGQGIGFKPRRTGDSETISDKFYTRSKKDQDSTTKYNEHDEENDSSLNRNDQKIWWVIAAMLILSLLILNG